MGEYLTLVVKVKDSRGLRWDWVCTCGAMGRNRSNRWWPFDKERNAKNGAAVHKSWHNRQRLRSALCE